MESNISENVTPKLVGMIVAIIVLACVMIPICNSLVSDGNGSGGGSSEDDSNLFNTTLKDVYGEDYPWNTVSGGFVNNYQNELQGNGAVTVANSDFGIAWDSQTASKYFTGPYWSSEVVNGNTEYTLDVKALYESYLDSEQSFKDMFTTMYPTQSSEELQLLPLYCMFTGIRVYDSPSETATVSSSSIDYMSPVGVGYDFNENLSFGTVTPNYSTPTLSIYPSDEIATYSSITLTFFTNTEGGYANVRYTESWMNNGSESSDDTYWGVDSVLFFSESENGYIPLVLNKHGANIPLEEVSTYFSYYVYNGAFDGTNWVLSKQTVADNLINGTVTNGNTTEVVAGSLFDFNGQMKAEYRDYSGDTEGTYAFVSSTDTTLDITGLGRVIYNTSTQSYTYYPSNDFESEVQEYILPYTLAVLPSASDSGSGSDSGSDSGGVSGISATIIKLLPVFVAIGLILAMVSMFYDPRQLLGGQQ